MVKPSEVETNQVITISSGKSLIFFNFMIYCQAIFVILSIYTGLYPIESSLTNSGSLREVQFFPHSG